MIPRGYVNALYSCSKLMHIKELLSLKELVPAYYISDTFIVEKNLNAYEVNRKIPSESDQTTTSTVAPWTKRGFGEPTPTPTPHSQKSMNYFVTPLKFNCE